MKVKFLRNCRNISEYNYFKLQQPEYFDVFEIIVTKTVKLSDKELETLEENTSSHSFWKEICFKDFYYDKDIAYCIRVQDSYFRTHSYVFFNGFNYTKYIAFI